jgi:virginiamycin B lyase
MKKALLLAFCLSAMTSCAAPHQALPQLGGAPTGSDAGVALTSNNILFLIYEPSLYPTALLHASDGSIWFTADGSIVERLTPTNSLNNNQSFLLPTHGNPLVGNGMAPGPSGTMLISDDTYVVEMRTNGVMNNLVVPWPGTASAGITLGPDGNFWFADQQFSEIGRMTPTGSVTEFPTPTQYSTPTGIVVGSDGNLWFTESFVGKIGRIAPDGTITEFALPSADGSAYSIVAASDGNLYAPSDYRPVMEKISTSGTITGLPLPQPAYYVYEGPGKKLWLAYANAIGTFDVASGVAGTPVPLPNGLSPTQLATGSDGNVWFGAAAEFSNYIGAIAPIVTTIGVRLNGEMSIDDPNYGFELGYAKGSSTTTQTISVRAGGYLQFKNYDHVAHTASFLGDATNHNAPWPPSFNGGMTASPKLVAIGAPGFSTGAIEPRATSLIYATGLPGFYMIGCGFHYDSNEMRTVVVVR